MPIKFYRECNEPYGCFSNFSKHSFEVNGMPWQTVEQHHAGPALRFPAAILRPRQTYLVTQDAEETPAQVPGGRADTPVDLYLLLFRNHRLFQFFQGFLRLFMPERLFRVYAARERLFSAL